MRFSDLFRAIFQKPCRRRMGSGSCPSFRRPSRTCLSVMGLEDRLTPTANLTLTGVSVVDSRGNPLSAISPGEQVYVSASFETLNLPASASYRIGYTVNGVTEFSSYLTTNAGVSGSGSTSSKPQGTFIATPGTNEISVTVDPDHSVAESSYADNTMAATFDAAGPSVGSLSYSVAQIRTAYGLNSVPNFGSALADGAGQTIAIVDYGNDPYVLSDLNSFDEAMDLTLKSTESLYQQFGAAASFVTVYNQEGQNITADIAHSGSDGVPPLDGGWQSEETMDVESAHAIAPGAKIDIIEVATTNALIKGDEVASTLPGVTTVSNSWGFETGSETGYNYDDYFVTPAGHTGITYLVSSGDSGANNFDYDEKHTGQLDDDDPATSPNVISVGATDLTLTDDAAASETAWSFPAPTTADTALNGSSKYSQAGPWTAHPGGFSGTYSTVAGGSSAAATWTIPVNASDEGSDSGVEVSTTWTAGPNNATNATYSVYDGTAASGKLLGKFTVDQTKAPEGTADGGSQFQQLGVLYPTTNTLTVVLDASSANGRVVADAVGAAQAWATTGGVSAYEPEPTYQSSVQDTGSRTTPDVSFDGSDSSGLTCYETPEGHLSEAGLGYDYYGTSLSSPCWAGLIAIADQGRVATGSADLNSPSNPHQTLQALYSLPAADFNDITTGYTGDEAGPGYDLATGLGSPIANKLIPDLVGYGLKPAATHLGTTAGPLSGGETVTITGAHLVGASAVTFGGVAAASFTVVSSTEITAVVPAHAAGAVNVAVTTSGGTTAASSAVAFTFVAPPAVTKLSASDGPAAGGNRIAITGTGLAGATAVDFGGTAATIVSNSATLLIVSVPAGSPGASSLTVTTHGGEATAAYTYVAAPTIAAVTPAYGPVAGGTTVTITGTALADATVLFGTRAGAIVSDSAQKIVVTSPTGATGTATLAVTTAGGTAKETFTYVGLPVLTGVSPKSGTLAGGTTVTITGISLLDATGVGFGSAAGKIVSVSNTALVAITPAGPLGKVPITVTTGQGTSRVTPAALFGYVPAADPATSTVKLSAGTVAAGKAVLVTLQAKNASGDVLTSGGLVVAFAVGGSGAGGTFGPVADHGNGTYSALFTATRAGTGSVTATISGAAVSLGAALTVTPGALSLLKSYVSASATELPVGTTMAVTLTATDAYGNPEPTGGLDVAFELIDLNGSRGNFDPVTDNGDGTYTTTFMGTVPGHPEITATIDGKDIGSTPESITIY